MSIADAIFVGVKGQVVAYNKLDGRLIWQSQLKQRGVLSASCGFVTLLVEGNRIYVHRGGELFCLDAATGQHLWKNEMAGLGFGIATLAVENASAPSAAVLATILQRQQQQSSGVGNASTHS